LILVNIFPYFFNTFQYFSIFFNYFTNHAGRPRQVNQLFLQIIDQSASSHCCIESSQYVEINGILNNFQSVFWSGHSTATALAKITNDLLMASEAKLVSILKLFFSKGFDSVNHELLCLSHQYGFTTCTVNHLRFTLPPSYAIGHYVDVRVESTYNTTRL
jgi:hypothetical protein